MGRIQPRGGLPDIVKKMSVIRLLDVWKLE